MMPNATINPPNTPIAGNFKLAPEWWRFFYSLNQGVNEVAAGAVTTLTGSGLEGGGNVSEGISLSITNNGVTNAMLRQSLSTSVMGRAFGSNGNVADIQAVADNTVMSRVSGQLMFTPSPQVSQITTDVLELTGTPAASTATVTHSIPIETGSGTMYVLLSSTP